MMVGRLGASYNYDVRRCLSRRSLRSPGILARPVARNRAGKTKRRLRRSLPRVSVDDSIRYPSPETGSSKFQRGWVLMTLHVLWTWLGPSDSKLGKETCFIVKIKFVNRQVGWLVGQNNLYRTNDAGRTWNVVLKLPPLS